MSTAQPLQRPRSVQEMLARVQHMITPQGMGRALAFQPRASDVFIATFPKSGTTWLQQIVHCLRTGGDMAFEEITEVVPWLETALDLGLDIDAPQRAEPRAYKCHLPWQMIPKGGRYLVAVRDPRDVLVSQYHFWNGWFFETGSVSVEDLARGLFLNEASPFSYYRHLQSWWPRRLQPDVLMLCYESMLADPEAAIRRIADFIGAPPDPALLARVLEQSSVEFMRAHARQFDDHLLRDARDEACGLPPGTVGGSKVRAGRAGANATELTDAIRAELDAVWQRDVAGPLGLASYDELRRVLSGVE
jgi:hypothetical protein